VTKIYEELDCLRLESRKKDQRGKSRALTKRLFLGTKSKPDRCPHPEVYPMMLEGAWNRAYLAGHEDEQIFTKALDPIGFGNNLGAT
jgi:hypothetical protein